MKNESITQILESLAREHLPTWWLQFDKIDNPQITSSTYVSYEMECLLQFCKAALEHGKRLEREEANEDAERYRWIKQQSDGRPFYFHGIGHRYPENLDQAIDDAMRSPLPQPLKE